MKRNLLLLFSLTLLFSCSQTKEERELYNLEKVYYKAEKLRQTLLIHPQSAPKEEYEKLISAYKIVLKKFPSSQAIKSFTPQIKKSSNVAISSGLRIAELYLGLGKIEEAKKELENILSFYPQNKEQLGLVVLHLAQLNTKLGDQDQAQSYYERIYNIENYPPYSEKGTPNLDLMQTPLYLLTLSTKDEEEKQERFQKAKDYYEELIALNKSPQLNLASTLNLAQTYRAVDQWEDVVNTLYQAKDSTGKVPDYLLLEIGDIYLHNPQIKDENKALSLYQEIITNSPQSAQADLAKLRMGIYYADQGETKEAKKYLSTLAKKSKIPQIASRAQFLYASLFEKEEKWEEALTEYQWLITNQENSDEALEASLILVKHYQKEKNTNLVEKYLEKAKKHYQRIIEKNQSESSKAKRYLALLYLTTQSWDDALVVLQELEKSSTPPGKIESLLLQADIYENKKGDKEKAKELYQKALSLTAGSALADSIKTKIARL